LTRIWLASYPKSGNTWLRMQIANLSATEGPVEINNLPERGGIASAREPFDHLTLIDSGLLTLDEIDSLRPRVYEALAAGAADDEYDAQPERAKVSFVKVHDAYTMTPNGEPLLAGARGAAGAVVVVRDPRDVAPSLAHHNGTDIDEAIAFMGNVEAGFCARDDRQAKQLRQFLPGWSGFMTSWLEQTDIPVHLVRYEDMKSDAPRVLRGVLDFARRPATDAEIERAVAFADFRQLRKQEQDKGFREASRAGRFFRRGDTGSWREELTPEQAARIERDHAPMMRRLGYPLSTMVASAGAEREPG
jgi:aryl sulfotransferase